MVNSITSPKKYDAKQKPLAEMNKKGWKILIKLNVAV